MLNSYQSPETNLGDSFKGMGQFRKIKLYHAFLCTLWALDIFFKKREWQGSLTLLEVFEPANLHRSH